MWNPGLSKGELLGGAAVSGLDYLYRPESDLQGKIILAV
jgi:hypothetical protein